MQVQLKTLVFLAVILNCVNAKGIEVQDIPSALERVDEVLLMVDDDAGYETCMTLAQSVRAAGVRLGNSELEVRGLARMILVELTYAKWGPQWKSWQKRLLELTAKLPSPSQARAESLMIDGYLKAMYLKEVSEGIVLLNEAVVLGRELQDDRLLGQAFCYLGVALVFDGQQKKAKESFERSILFARNSQFAELEFFVLELSTRFRLPNEELRLRLIDLSEQLKVPRPVSALEPQEQEKRLEELLSECRSELDADPPRDMAKLGAVAFVSVQLLKFASEKNDWDRTKAYVETAERAAILLQDSTTSRILGRYHAMIAASEGDGQRAMEHLLPTINYHAQKHISAELNSLHQQLAGLLMASGDIESASEFYALAAASERNWKQEQEQQIRQAAQAYIDDELRTRELRTQITERESALADSVATNRLLMLAIPLLAFTLFFWQRSRQARLTEVSLRRQVEQQTASLKAATDDALVARNQAMSASQAKTDFLARINHELRNPLTAIVGSCELLEANNTGSLPSATRTIKACTHNLLDVVNDVLDFTKIESGTLESQNQDFSPRELLKTVEAILKPRVSPDTSLAIHVDDTVPAAIFADEPKLRQVLLNLGQNAARHTDHGIIEVTVTLANGESHSESQHLSIIVRDTGTGISESLRQDIFDPYVKGDSKSGSGLGLYISAAFVKCMNGRMDLESEAGFGTSFEITLPFGSVDPNEIASVCRDKSERNKVRVLVVDDEAANRTVLTQLVSKLSHQCQSVEAWSDVETILDAGVDIILMDLRMGAVSGFEMLKRIQNKQLSNMPAVVAMTGDATEDTRRKTEHAGFHGFLAKPFTLATLSSVIERFSTVSSQSQVLAKSFAVDTDC